MKFFGLTAGFKLTKDRIIASTSVVSIIALCCFSGLGISALLDADAQAAVARHEQEVSEMLESSDSSDTDTSSDSSDGSEDTTPSSESAAVTSSDTSETSGSDPSTSDQSQPSDQTSESTSASTSATATSETTTQTTIGESTHNAIVYATRVINLRTGPGTSYESIRQLSRGDRIDVIAVTTNGWYKTIRGNYVSAQYTQAEPINTPSPTPKPATPTPKPATPTPKPTQQTTSGGGGGSGNMELVGNFRVTFYIPVNGTRTASGSTATMGRTVAANKNDFPFGTVIYVENDPLGGDGYYTVEDRGVGTGVIDIFVDGMGDVPGYGTTTRKVYIVR